MNAVMFSQMGLSLAGRLADYSSAKTSVRLQDSIQKYQNAINSLNAVRSKNAITLNEASIRDASIEQDAELQISSLKDQASAEVAAASAGVGGDSVRQVARDLKGSLAKAQFSNKRQFNRNLAELGVQRQSVEIARITGTSAQVLPKPSVSSMLLGAGSNLLAIYDRAQPPGEKILE